MKSNREARPLPVDKSQQPCWVYEQAGEVGLGGGGQDPSEDEHNVQADNAGVQSTECAVRLCHDVTVGRKFISTNGLINLK